MKKGTYRWGIVGLILAAAGVAWMQTPDFAGLFDVVLGVNKDVPGAMHANAADSSTRVDRAGYQMVGLVVVVGQSDITSAVGSGDYIVLQDSTPGTAAWVAQDSTPMDSTDGKAYKLTYKGVRRFVRTLARASGNNADTVAYTAIWVLGNKRARP